MRKQGPAQSNPTFFTSGQMTDFRVSLRAAQCMHRLIDLSIDLPRIRVVDLLLQRRHLVVSFLRFTFGELGCQRLRHFIVVVEKFSN